MNIQTVTKETGLSAHTLRYYEKVGIIFEIERDASGHRIYAENHLNWIRFVIKLKSSGMSIKQIRHYASLVKQGPDTVQERLEIMKAHKQKMLQKMSELKENLKMIDYKINYYLTSPN